MSQQGSSSLVVASKNETTFDYLFKNISDLSVVTVEDPVTGKLKVESVLVDDEPIQPTQRFWTSLFARYGFNKAFFKYFNHVEVFKRIAERENESMRLCIERTTLENGKQVSSMLAVSSPKKPVVTFDELTSVLERYHAGSVTYTDGIVESWHTPTRGSAPFKELGDSFDNQFVMQSPVDGYGAPNIYLSLLREACDNGTIALSKVFRSGVALGKVTDDVTHSITRALEGFNNDEGFDALRNRIKSSGNSWASVFEATTLYNLMVKLVAKEELLGGIGGVASSRSVLVHKHIPHDISDIGSPILQAFRSMTGDVQHLYGLANVDALSPKRQKTLPVKCTVYDIINFATEAATHWAQPHGARMLNSYVGGLVSAEYDLEGTMDKFANFSDFYITSKLEGGLTGAAAASRPTPALVGVGVDDVGDDDFSPEDLD